MSLVKREPEVAELVVRSAGKGLRGFNEFAYLTPQLKPRSGTAVFLWLLLLLALFRAREGLLVSDGCREVNKSAVLRISRSKETHASSKSYNWLAFGASSVQDHMRRPSTE